MSRKRQRQKWAFPSLTLPARLSFAPSIGGHLPVHCGQEFGRAQASEDAIRPKCPANDTLAVYQDGGRRSRIAAAWGRVRVKDLHSVGEVTLRIGHHTKMREFLLSGAGLFPVLDGDYEHVYFLLLELFPVRFELIQLAFARQSPPSAEEDQHVP
jgi:hypothetical protein